MKTTVVLLALATAALAAPALHEDTFGDNHHIPANFLNTFARERKSTLESSSSLTPGNPASVPTSQISEFGVSGRSFNLKKPIIIKKKVGSSYQVYRDSDEEKLDSPEPCRKQVRVSVCDDSIVKSDMMRSSTNEDPTIQMAEDDMKHSIMLAKEVVENLQSEMRNSEHKPPKTIPWKHGDSESDMELHQDIEKARQALEHIHNNFGNLEKQNLHDSTQKEASVIEDAELPLAHTEEERLAQWKDAIESIHRNFELVRNIEDSFKSTPHDLSHVDETVASINEHDMHKSSTKNMRDTEEHGLTFESLEQSKNEKASEHSGIKADLAENDMMGSASMVSSTKVQELDHKDKARLAFEIQPKDDEHSIKSKDPLEEGNAKHTDETITLDQIPLRMDTLALKAADDEEEQKTDFATDSPKTMKSVDSKEPLDLSTNVDFPRNNVNEAPGKTLNHGEHDEHEEKSEDKKFEVKSAEVELEKDQQHIHENHHTMNQPKEAGEDTSSITELNNQGGMAHKDHSLVQGKKALNENLMMPVFADSSDKHKLVHSFDGKSAEVMKNMDDQIFDQTLKTRWAQDKNLNAAMKSAHSTHQAMEHANKMHPGHHHTEHASPHHMGLASHGHMRHADHFVHGKSADMDMLSNYYSEMRNTDNQGQDGHRFRWRPSHESGRTAYGAPAPASAPATGAIGVFPNANVGCGIPLLLSCNPSVVSGSLSKAHSASYSAPAYRSEEDFTFHSKRDIKKTENRVNKHSRTPTQPILKTNPLIVAQQ